MGKQYKYYVIGGQYESFCYGGSDSLQGAKMLATKNEEYWDNFQGWHKPSIYHADDVQEIESKGRVTTADGVFIIAPKFRAIPVCYWNIDEKKWITLKEVITW